MAIHQRAALLLPLFVLLLVSKVFADDGPAVVGIVLAQGHTSNSDSKWAVNVDEGRVQLGRKLVVQVDGDDTNDYAPTGPSHKHDPHFPPSVGVNGDDTNDYAPTGPSHKHDPHFPPSV